MRERVRGGACLASKYWFESRGEKVIDHSDEEHLCAAPANTCASGKVSLFQLPRVFVRFHSDTCAFEATSTIIGIALCPVLFYLVPFVQTSLC